MKLRNFVLGILIIGSFMTSQYALSAPMEGVDDASQSSQTVRIPSKKSEKKQSSNLLSIVALLIGLSGSAVGGMAFLKVNKGEEELKKLRDAYAKDKEAMKAQISNLNNSVSNIKLTLSDVKSELSRCISIQNSVNYGQDNVRDNITEESYVEKLVDSQTNTQNRSQLSAPFKQYFGTPNQGVFSNPSQNYVAGKTLYYVQGNTGDHIASYFYMDNTEAAFIAARSISRFVEIGCVIRGEIRNNFSKVVTVKPGTVVRTSFGWKIETKAVVELV